MRSAAHDVVGNILHGVEDDKAAYALGQVQVVVTNALGGLEETIQVNDPILVPSAKEHESYVKEVIFIKRPLQQCVRFDAAHKAIREPG